MIRRDYQLYTEKLIKYDLNVAYKCIHKKRCCGVSSYNPQIEHFGWNIIPK